jgi:hypothetical protein
MDVKGVLPFDLPVFVLDILLLNKTVAFREAVTWIELAELARRMARSKDSRVEQLEREVWFKVCAAHNGGGEAEDHVVQSIFLWGNAGVEWFSAGVQTLLLTPAFRSPVLLFLKGAQRHWFPRELHGAEIGLQLLKMGVWCDCKNLEPPFVGGTIFIKRQRRDNEGAATSWKLPPEKWKTGTMHKAWRDFIVGRSHLDECVLENIRLVQDPELVRRMDEINNFWKYITPCLPSL